jgi:hypothetical protein
MKIWNLNTLDDLEATVLIRFQQSPPSRRPSVSPRVKSVFTVIAAGAVMTTAMFLHYPSVSATSLSMTQQPAIAQSVPRAAPPLSDMFAGRFSDNWSLDEEQLALRAMSDTFSKKPPQFDEREMVDVALANQQESFAPDVPRLSRDEVRKAITKRRSS